MSNSQDNIVLNSSNNSYVVLSDSWNLLARSNHDGPLRVLFSIVGSCITEKLQNLDVCWHLKCYKSFTHKMTVNTAKGKFVNLKDIEDESCKSAPIEDTSESDQQTPHFTRSNAPIYEKVIISSVTYRVRSSISFDISHMTPPVQHWDQLWNCNDWTEGIIDSHFRCWELICHSISS